jgi:hypothetical protein
MVSGPLLGGVDAEGSRGGLSIFKKLAEE